MRYAVFTLFILLYALTSQAVEQDKLIFANSEWPPYQSEQLRYYGFGTHIITEAFATVGIRVEYRFMPWKRCLLMTQVGEVNGTFLGAREEERSRYAWYSDPVLWGGEAFFYNKAKDFDWHSLEDLRDLRIGATLGNSYGESFDQAARTGEIQVEWASREEINLRKLLAQRIDVFPLDPEVGLTLLQTKFTEREAAQITYHPKYLRQYSLHVLFSKKVEKNQVYLRRFNEGLRQLKVSGRLDQFIQESRRGDYNKP